MKLKNTNVKKSIPLSILVISFSGKPLGQNKMCRSSEKLECDQQWRSVGEGGAEGPWPQQAHERGAAKSSRFFSIDKIVIPNRVCIYYTCI